MINFPRFLGTICVLLLLGGICFAQEGKRPGKRYALVIGVHEYAGDQPLPALPHAEHDAEDLQTVLTDGGYDVTLLTQSVGGQKGKFGLLPNAANIRKKLLGLCQNEFLAEQDTLLIALAGHGVLLPVFVDNKKTKGERFFFCPMDAEVNSIIDASKKQQFSTVAELQDKHALVAIDEIYASLGDGCKAGLKLLLVDACRNDPTQSSGNRALESVTLPPLPPPPGGIGAYFSCSKNQQAKEDKALKHGVFFHFVIEGLKGEADFTKDGKVTWPELNEYVGSNTYDYVFKKYGAKQTPEQMGQIRGKAELVSVGSRQPKLLTSLTNTLGQTLLPIPAGEFLMGNEDSVDALLKLFPYGKKEWFEDAAKQHKVRITKPFYLGKHEVTIGQFRQFVNATNYQTDAEKDGKGGRGYDGTTFKQDRKFSWLQTGAEPSPTDEHPVVNVSWNDAVAFCNWLSQQERHAAYYRLPAGEVVGGSGYRLPSEAEWEYACRAGSTTRYHQGNDPETLAKVGNVCDGIAKKKINFATFIAAEDGYVFTAPVGKYSANKFGLYDMHGNVAEWCGDWYAADFYDKSGQDDPRGRPTGGSDRVLRGGSWNIDAASCRSANRLRNTPDSRSFNIGFRVARSSDK